MAEEVIAIEGGHKLNGTVTISGAKNATVALIPSIVLSDEPVEIYNVPEISDVDALTTLLEELNCIVERDKSVGEIGVDPRNMKNIPLVSSAVDKLRASYYFMGALLGKYKEVTIRMPGGCYLGPRPIDLHLKGFEALGAKISYDEETGTYHLQADELIGTEIYLDFASVGATINIMLAAVKAKGRTVIENAAKEPEIIDVANLLTKMGARIRGVGTDTITIDGVEHMHGAYHEIIPDRIEAGTFLIIAAAIGFAFGSIFSRIGESAFPCLNTKPRAPFVYGAKRLNVSSTVGLSLALFGSLSSISSMNLDSLTSGVFFPGADACPPFERAMNFMFPVPFSRVPIIAKRPFTPLRGSDLIMPPSSNRNCK